MKNVESEVKEMEVKEAAKELGVHVNSIYSYINIGQIKAEKKGKSWDIPKSEVERLKTKQELTPRRAIQMYTYLIGCVEKDAEEAMNKTLWGLKRGNEDSTFKEAVERLSKIEKDTKEWDMLVEFKKYLEKGRDRWYYNVEQGHYGMDEIVEKTLQPSDKAVEYRNSGDYFVEDES